MRRRILVSISSSVAVLFISVHSTLFGAALCGQKRFPVLHQAPAKGLAIPVVADVADGRESFKLEAPPFQILPRPGATEVEALVSHQLASIINFDVELSTEFRSMLIGWSESVPYPDHWRGEITYIEIIPNGFLVDVKATPVMPPPFTAILSTTETYLIVNGKASLYNLPWCAPSIPHIFSAN